MITFKIDRVPFRFKCYLFDGILIYKNYSKDPCYIPCKDFTHKVYKQIIA